MPGLRSVIWVFGITLVLIGCAYLVVPEFMLGLTGSFVLDAPAQVDVIATYGGVQLGMGLYILYEVHGGESVPALRRLLVFAFAVVGGVRFAAALISFGEAYIHLAVGLGELVLAWVISRLPDVGGSKACPRS